MWILIGVGVLFLFFLYLVIINDGNCGSGFDDPRIGIPFILVGIVLLILLIALPISRMEGESKIRDYHEMKKTIKVARMNNSDIERAALQHDIIEMNNWINNAKYWNNTVWDIYIPDVIMELEPIE